MVAMARARTGAKEGYEDNTSEEKRVHTLYTHARRAHTTLRMQSSHSADTHARRHASNGLTRSSAVRGD